MQDVSRIEAEHIYWETAQGKADRVGGVGKHKAAMTVVKIQKIGDYPQCQRAIYDHCSQHLTTVG